MTIKHAPRAAAWLVGLSLIAAGSGRLAAEEADPLSALAPVPDVTVLVDVDGPAETASSRAVAGLRPTQAPVAASDIVLPEPPPVSVTVTAADQLSGALAARLGADRPPLHARLSKREREAMTAFYGLGDFKPVWIANGAWTVQARSIMDRLKEAQEDGLDPADYPAPALAGTGRESAAELVEADLKLSAAAVLYARDARGGRIEPSRLSALITPKLDLPAADAVLSVLAGASDAGAGLQAYNPPHAGYRALKAKLAEIRVGRTPDRLEAELVANMERWRWLPQDLGERHILVNVPEFRLRLMERERVSYEARVIVGKPETPTPLFSEVMDHAIVNPSWTVPPSIFKNEFHSDPALAAARGYEVINTKSGVTIRQPPGERNALGFIKFMFPNRHAVYLHDTPNRGLFGNERRAYSHGCVRLDQPFRFAGFVLGSEWTESRLRSLIGRGERTIRLPQKVPVHLAYFTAFVDETGGLRHAGDLYGVDAKVRAALKLGGAAPLVAEAKRATAPRKVSRRAQAVAEASRPAARKPVRRVQAAAPMPLSPPPERDFWWWAR